MGTRSRDLYSGRGRARHQSGVADWAKSEGAQRITEASTAAHMFWEASLTKADYTAGTVRSLRRYSSICARLESRGGCPGFGETGRSPISLVERSHSCA